jgi:hypothetical protein
LSGLGFAIRLDLDELNQSTPGDEARVIGETSIDLTFRCIQDNYVNTEVGESIDECIVLGTKASRIGLTPAGLEEITGGGRPAHGNAA